MNTNNKTSTEVNEIQTTQYFSDDALNYTFDEKCTAIVNWAANADVKFDTSMVESIHANAAKYKGPTHNQMRAINNIVSRYKINVSMWSY